MKKISLINIFLMLLLGSTCLSSQNRGGIPYPSNLNKEQTKEETRASISTIIEQLNDNDQGIIYSFKENEGKVQMEEFTNENIDNINCVELCWDLRKKSFCKNSTDNLTLLLKHIKNTGNEFVIKYIDYMYYTEFQILPRSRILKLKEEFLDKIFADAEVTINVEINYYDYSESTSNLEFNQKLIIQTKSTLGD